jgi:hypothetical protein
VGPELQRPALAGADRGGDDIGDGEHRLRGAPGY